MNRHVYNRLLVWDAELVLPHTSTPLVVDIFLPLFWISFLLIPLNYCLYIHSGESYNRGEKINISKLGADPGLTSEVALEVQSSQQVDNSNALAYRCKKCRRLVALQENVVDHIPGEGETSFDWHKRKSGNPFNKSEEPECSSIFVEPLRWMTGGKSFSFVTSFVSSTCVIIHMCSLTSCIKLTVLLECTIDFLDCCYFLWTTRFLIKSSPHVSFGYGLVCPTEKRRAVYV